MNVLIPGHRDKHSAADAEFHRLRHSFAKDLERWPGFDDHLIDTIRDVVPLADIEESDDSYLLDVELPGVRREDVSVEVTDGRLVVAGERRERQRVGLLRYQTRTTGRFRFAITLPVEVDRDGVTATLNNGIVTVTVPKAERARRRRIPIGSLAS